MKRSFILYTVLIILAVVVCGCQPKQSPVNKGKYSEARSLMGTTVRLDTCDEIDEEKRAQAYAQAWSRLEEISWRMNVYDPRSDIALINQSKGEQVRIEGDTLSVVGESLVYSEKTKNAFDITVKPLIDLWREAAKEGIEPSSEEIQRVREAVGSRNVEMKTNTEMRLLNPNTQIDIGGIAKGYAIDQVAEIFRTYGMDHFFIDAGGDVYASGRNCQNSRWRIGVQDPRERSKVLDIVHVSYSAVATSGNYEQYYQIKDHKWSHIINPITGYPQEGVISATVIAPIAIEADALATALTVLGPEEGTKLIDSFGLDYASVIFYESEGRFQKKESQRYDINLH